MSESINWLGSTGTGGPYRLREAIDPAEYAARVNLDAAYSDWPGREALGSVDLFAKAMRDVFAEAVAESVQPLKDALAGISVQVTHHQKALDEMDTADEPAG